MVLLGILLAFIVVAAVLTSGAVGVFACRGVYSSLTANVSPARMPQARAVRSTQWAAVSYETRNVGRAIVRGVAGVVAGIVGVAAAYALGLLCIAIIGMFV